MLLVTLLVSVLIFSHSAQVKSMAKPDGNSVPLVINTWDFISANEKGN